MVEPGQDQRAELEVVLASDMFSKSPNLMRLLRYMCSKSWEGKTEALKEYNLAVEALGRAPDFDPSTSPIVRVEVHRLREKLKKYYESDRSNHRLTITLPVGSYIPRFIPQEENSASATTSFHATHVDQSSRTLAPTTNGTNNKREPSSLQDTGHSGALQIAGGNRWLGWRRASMLAVSAIALIVLFVLGRRREVRLAQASLTTPQLGSTLAAMSGADAGPVRIVAGYLKDKYIDAAGNVWAGDRFFNGGNAGALEQRWVARTRDPTLFEYGRSGSFSYDIPLKPGSYELRLYFEETQVGPGTVLYEGQGGEDFHTFAVQLNGRSLLEGFDLYTDAGGNFRADVRVFKDVGPGPDGYLHLKLAGAACLSALAILPSARGKLNPLRLLAQNNTFTDQSGHVWEPDHYVMGGRLVLRPNQVRGTREPGLYAGERWGAFDYAIPVAEGKYGITLYFAEAYFGSLGPGGVGSRVFDVYCNGTALLRNFDIFKEAGGADRALQKTFHGLRANAQGKLMLTFVPVTNYCLLNAIEVVDES